MSAIRAISIHALHEESDGTVESSLRWDAVISIHALHEESDAHKAVALQNPAISIHALHEESDPLQRIFPLVHRYFNPRSP